MIFKTWPVRKKMMFAGLAPALLMFLVLLMFFTSIRMEEAKRHLHSIGDLTAKQIATASEFAVITGDQAWLKNLLDKTILNDGIHSIEIRGIMGEVLASSSNPMSVDEEANTAFRADIIREQASVVTSQELDWFQSSFDFTKSNYKVGTVVVHIDHSVLRDKQWDIAADSFIVALVLMIIAWLIIKSIARTVSWPMQQLSQQVNEVAKGKLSPVHVEGSPEFIQLTKDINALILAITNSEQTLNQSIEELQSEKHKAENANRAKSDFLAMMSHELRTPMNGVMGMLQLLTESQLSPQQQDHVLTAMQSTEHLLTVVNDILDFSRVETGKLNIEMIDFNLESLVRNCFASFKHEANLKGLSYSLSFEGEPENPSVVADPTRLRQVMVNLIANAIKFTSIGSVSVVARWQKQDDKHIYFQCDILDTGIGIPPERLASMFNSFEQADVSTSRKYGGSGLGLAIVQRLVELMGGNISVESLETNGSHFKISLPLKLSLKKMDPIFTDTPAPVQSALTPGGLSGHALVVEDNPVNQKVTVAMLRKVGLSADIAENGEEAIERYRAHHYDIIFMDCQMPVMDGFKATAHIREIERLESRHKTPIIALTANAISGIEKECLGCGMDDYMSKPVKKDTLVSKTRSWLN